MRIDEQARQCISFLSIPERPSHRDRLVFKTVGTAFYVGINVGRDRVIKYAITAKHLLDGSRYLGSLHIRCVKNHGETTVFECPQDNWWVHPTTDVAAMRVTFTLEDYDLRFLPIELLATDAWLREHDVGIGDRLIISGMFSQFIGKVRDEPLVRFGRIALIPKDEVRVPSRNGLPAMEFEAILAEAASWGGQSGSPVFVYFSVDRSLFAGNTLEMRIPNPRLLGLVHGHYVVPQRIWEKQSEYSEMMVPLNAGIAIIVPAPKVIELLMSEPIVEDREQVKAILREEGLID